ncbi:hypothetical protein [Streptomyces lavendulae]|uniref:hypothetical protein n=1 Tax=Streptomyces lavendulae TaxID=1914 RepID=UPI0024A0BE71|nr:hypothetical protein [Streptomyces lavendulae]GLW04184.1 hypothetical protein Slala05_78140 [Streptomyces lavendulae subsp. lavendulae]
MRAERAPVTGRRFTVGQKVFDRDRQAHGDVVGLHPSPLVVRLSDAAGFQWVARTVACEHTGPRPAVRNADGDGVRIPPGQVPVDIPPTALRVGDRILSDGRLVAIADLRYRHGGTRTMILSTGRVTAAERTVRVYRSII